MKFIYMILLLIFSAMPCASQLSADTVLCRAGQKAKLKITIVPGSVPQSVHTVTGAFILGNPTLFFPEGFLAGANTLMESQAATRINDSLYRFSATIVSLSEAPPCFYLSGEALAGHDSLCRIDFFDTRINNDSVNGFTGLIINRPDYSDAGYARYADLGPAYPNPSHDFSPIRWNYTIDKTTDITFFIFDTRGNELYRHTAAAQSPGSHVFTFIPDDRYACGQYFIRLSTYSGYLQNKFSIIR